MRVHKIHPVTLTRVEGRKVRALVSVFHNVDTQGDRVMPGSFQKSIRRWRASGDPIPFIWSHEWQNPLAFVGGVDPNMIRETDRGLEVEAELDQDTEFSRQVARLLADRRVQQFSFAYDTVREKRGEDGANELLELDLIECGPCLRGANPETGLLSGEPLSVKSTQALLARESGFFTTTTSTNTGTYTIRDRFEPVAHEQSIYRETLDALAGTKATDRQLREQVDALAREQEVARQLDNMITDARLAHVQDVVDRSPRPYRAPGSGGIITNLIGLSEPIEDVPGETYRVPLYTASESPTTIDEEGERT